MRVNRVERNNDVLQKFAEELGIQWTGAQMEFAYKIKRHLIAEIKGSINCGENKAAQSMLDDVAARIERLS